MEAKLPPSLGANILRGWLRARDDLRRKLVRSATISGVLGLAALIATPAVVWIYRAERGNRLNLEKSLRAAKIDLQKAQLDIAAAQPKIERAKKFEAIQNRSRFFINSELNLIADAPAPVVLSTVSASVIQGKLTMRVVAEAPSKEIKSQYESAASRGPNVLAAFVTNLSFERPLFPGGMRFEFVKIAEAGL